MQYKVTGMPPATVGRCNIWCCSSNTIVRSVCFLIKLIVLTSNFASTCGVSSHAQLLTDKQGSAISSAMLPHRYILSSIFAQM